MGKLTKKRVAGLTLALVFVQCFSTGAQKVTSGRNYLRNGGFEDYLYRDWRRIDRQPGDNDVYRLREGASTGYYGVRLQNACLEQRLLPPDEFPFLFECRSRGDKIVMEWRRMTRETFREGFPRPAVSYRSVLKHFRASEFTYFSSLISDVKSNFTDVVVEFCTYEGVTADFDQCSVKKVKPPSRSVRIGRDAMSYTEKRNPHFEMGRKFWRLGKGATISHEEAIVGDNSLKLSGRGARASRSFILEAVNYIYTFSCRYKGPRDPTMLIIRKRYEDLVARRDPDPEPYRVDQWNRISITMTLPRYDEYEFRIIARPEDTTYVDDCSLVRESSGAWHRRIFPDLFS